MKKSLPEIIALGAYDASLIHKNALETPPRRVRMYEIETILEDGGCSYIDGREYPIKAGSVLIGKPGQMRHTVLPFKCLYLHLMVDDAELDECLRTMPDVYQPTSAALSESLERLISAYTLPQTDAGMQVAAELCTLLSRLIHDTRLSATASRSGGKHAEAVERAIEFMDAHFCQNMTLEQIADRVYLSRIYFHKLFLAATGRTPYRYLLERRLAHAQKLLMTTELSLGEISRECGFSSQSYFNQVFLRELGSTPTEYKKEMLLRY